MTLRLHSFPLSGHAHRARLMLALLGLQAEVVDVDLRGGAQKQPSYLAMNAFGQVPVLEDGDPENPVVIADSNAILVYLAGKYDRSGRWLPADPATAAQVQRWLSVAAGQLLMGPARARMVKLFSSPFDHDACRQAATQLFDVMEQHLQGRDWLAATHATIADIALYSYTAHAPEGDVSLEPYPGIRAWIARIEALPGFVPMRA
ncbi:glutathione S-transferase family protein [Ferrovibrio sp.]|uniref:glutathione S-transferase family protein n=1 Tax=Ferrovibrio sp. TaxID=1917215 RepID=UPI000CCA937F|nr:glutathione S-transferase [Ferrovibrio sp.]PJI43786.1 MAG: glutathione S-transferase [Ferrovibrio sp.]